MPVLPPPLSASVGVAGMSTRFVLTKVFSRTSPVIFNGYLDSVSTFSWSWVASSEVWTACSSFSTSTSAERRCCAVAASACPGGSICCRSSASWRRNSAICRCDSSSCSCARLTASVSVWIFACTSWGGICCPTRGPAAMDRRTPAIAPASCIRLRRVLCACRYSGTLCLIEDLGISRLLRDTRRGPSRDAHPKDGFSGTAADQDQVSAMFGGDAVCQRQSKPRSFLLALADKGLKEACPNVGRHTRAIVRHLNQDLFVLHVKPNRHMNRIRKGGPRLAGIQQQVVNSPFDLLSVHHRQRSGRLAVIGHDTDVHAVGMFMDQSNRALQNGGDQLRGPPDGISRPAEDEHGLDQLSRSIDGRLNILENFGALRLGEPRGGKELGVGINGGEIVAEVMRNGTGHSADGGQPLRFQQSPVGLLNLLPHLRNGRAQVAHFPRAPQRQQVPAVTGAEGTHACSQLLQRTRDGVREGQHQQTAQGKS